MAGGGAGCQQGDLMAQAQQGQRLEGGTEMLGGLRREDVVVDQGGQAPEGAGLLDPLFEGEDPDAVDDVDAPAEFERQGAVVLTPAFGRKRPSSPSGTL